MAQNQLGPYWLRVAHVLFVGHDLGSSASVDKLRSELHPATDAEWVYTVNIMRCRCGLHWLDAGVERRDRTLPFPGAPRW